MAAVRGRGRSEMGQLFGPVFTTSGGPAIPGQPVMIRMQGVPTMPGYRDRIPKWNVILPPLIVLGELISEFFKRLRG